MVQGQILANLEFSNRIQKIIEENKPKVIVEIGTWRGMGSTKRIIDSIIDGNFDTNFISIESNKTFYSEAVINLEEYQKYVNLIYGRIVDENHILDFINSHFLSEEQKKWLDSDINDIKLCKNVLNLIPHQIDFLLLDGGEFSTYKEWEILKERTSIVALDDTRELKCRRIREELINDFSYELIFDSEERNGCSIFKKK